MTDIREVLQEIARRADAATPGTWDPIDGNEGTEYGPMWMVTNDEFHNPTGDEDAPWLAVEIHVGRKEDAEFIAHARTDLPRCVAALRAVLDLHVADGEGYGGKVVCAYCSWLDEDLLVDYPCDTVEAITEALGGDA